MEQNKNNNNKKHKADQIIVANELKSSKTDEIIMNNKNNNNNVLTIAQEQLKKGGKQQNSNANSNSSSSNKKKKHKQKNSHNNNNSNDKDGAVVVVADDELCKQKKKSKQEIAKKNAQPTKEIKIQAEDAKKVIADTDNNQNNNNTIERISHVNEEEEEDVVVESANLPLNKPFIATLEPFTTTTSEISDDSEINYCPLTPRRIVDVNDDEQDELMTVKQQQRNENLKVVAENKSKNDKHMTDVHENTTTNDIDHDDYYDDNDDDYDDGDNGLLLQFLGEANRIAEAKLAQRRQARAEAREIRMRELERQQKEQEQNADRVFDMHTNTTGVGDALSRARLTGGMANLSINSVLNATRANSMCSRRSSEDSLEEEGRSLRDIRHELKDVEERFRKAMIANAQLDNERASQTYQIQLLKDKLEEMEESYAQLQREFKDKSKECNAFKRQLDKLTEELKLVQGQLNERDTLISEQGLVIVAVENDDGSDARRALVTVENAQLLGTVQGSLDVRLKKFSEEKQQLMAEVQRLQDQLDNYKSHGKQRGSTSNGPMSDDEYEAQREANKIILDYKYKLQKAEQEIASLQSSLARSETQVIRYKSTAEAAEKAEAELKIERRKLQRENREAMERLEELETANNHLLKRMDKLKNVKSALLKDL